MRLTFGGKRIELSTGFRIDADKWDDTKMRVKPKYSNKQKQTAADINAALSNYEQVVQEVFKEFEVQDLMPTPEQFREKFDWFLAGKPEKGETTEKDEPKKTNVDSLKGDEKIRYEIFHVVYDAWNDKSIASFAQLVSYLKAKDLPEVVAYRGPSTKGCTRNCRQQKPCDVTRPSNEVKTPTPTSEEECTCNPSYAQTPASR